MNDYRLFGVFCALSIAFAASAAERFEAAAWVDSYDFAAVRDTRGKLLFDTETPEGNRAILNAVCETGATTILWRNCGGATMRYISGEEKSATLEAPLDKRRLPSDRPIYGWLRYGRAKPDIVRDMLGECHARGLGAGIHWPFEETHWASWTFGAWNFEHPQYWGVTAKGQVWSGRCSLAYPEVVAHKLRLADELLDRGMDHLFVDTRRTGGWGPGYEYVRPEIERWRKTHRSEPPTDPKDPQWCAFVSETTSAYFVALRRQLGTSGRRVRFMLGISEVGIVGDAPDATLLSSGVDWRRLVREGVVDALVVMNVSWDRARPFESTREIYRSVRGFCEGRCQVLFPVTLYDFEKHGIPSFQRATGQSAERVAGQLLLIAWEEGADGVSMECVDYGNYSPAVCAELRRLLDGPCRFKRASVRSTETVQ